MGEVALIVIGVTVALWADSWVAERGDRSRELARLAALHDDTSKTLAALTAERGEALAAAEALRKILVYEPPYRSSPELLALLRHGLLYGPQFHPELSVYQDLKSSGELALLTNAELRQALSGMAASLERLRLAQADVIMVQQLNVDSYMMEHIDLRTLLAATAGLEPPGGGNEASYDYISDIAFQNRLLFKLDLVSLLADDMADVEKVLRDVLNYLEFELAK